MQQFKKNVHVLIYDIPVSGESAEDTVVTFIDQSSTLKLQGWDGTRLEFSFKTFRNGGILLYQPSHTGLWTSAQLSVQLIYGETIRKI